MPQVETIMEPRAFSTAMPPFDCDIAVVGGGLGGLSAAITAAENGARAIVLEKMNFLGGAGIFPEGSMGIGTRYQKQQGIRITAQEVFEKVMEFHHWRCNAPAIRALLDESGKTIDWLTDLGVAIEGIKTMFPSEKSLQVWHVFKGRGARVVKILSEHVKKRNVPVLTSTAAKELLVNDQGAVRGIVAETAAGKRLSVTAKAVVLATGGFAGNRDMLKKYVPDISAPGMAKLMHRGPAADGRTGDGIRMALSVDAGLCGMGTLAGNSPYLDCEPAIRQFRGPESLKQTRCALSQPFLWVNRHGERFYNESLGSVFSDVYNAMTSNGGLMWSIFDARMKRRLVENGPLTPFNAIVVPGQKMTALDKGIQDGIASGYAFKADTIEALAQKIDVSPHRLRKTIETINRWADAKKDPDFNRKAEHLFKFDTENGPYYALKGLRAYFLTLGGIRINRHMQGLDAQGERIPGLYVAGQDIGGLYDSTYDLLAEGSASSFALSSGRIAVKSIVQNQTP